MYASALRSKHFEDESVDFRILTTHDSDRVVVKCGKFFLRHLFGSVRKIISHSRVLRRFLSLKGLPTVQGTLMMFKNMTETIDMIETTNGVMISHLDIDKMGGFSSHL
jgi:hypothetical protein